MPSVPSSAARATRSQRMPEGPVLLLRRPAAGRCFRLAAALWALAEAAWAIWERPSLSLGYVLPRTAGGASECCVVSAVRPGVTRRRMRHPRRDGRRGCDGREAHRTARRRRVELHALDLHVRALVGSAEDIIECTTGLSQRVRPVGEDDRSFELHPGSAAFSAVSAIW